MKRFNGKCIISKMLVLCLECNQTFESRKYYFWHNLLFFQPWDTNIKSKYEYTSKAIYLKWGNFAVIGRNMHIKLLFYFHSLKIIPLSSNYIWRFYDPSLECASVIFHAYIHILSFFGRNLSNYTITICNLKKIPYRTFFVVSQPLTSR